MPEIKYSNKRGITVCKGCEPVYIKDKQDLHYRHLGCHTYCERYLDQKNAHLIQKAQLDKQKQLEIDNKKSINRAKK